MKVLVLNAGSSSVKFLLAEVEAGEGGLEERTLARGALERIGSDSGLLRLSVPGREPIVHTGEVLDHRQAIEQVLWALTSVAWGPVLGSTAEVEAVGHRVVHGGEHFSGSVAIDAGVEGLIRECIDLAPLHNPHNLRGIQACRHLLAGVAQVAVFDTAFHQSMPPESFLYAIPHVLYTRHRVRRYGFHGSSHSYVYQRSLALTRRTATADPRVITAHLGNGCSLAAIRGGRSLDTSMGLTPLEGLVMGTRSGDLDPQVVLHVMAREELNPSQASTMLNKHSGLQGLSGISSDMRDLLAAAAEGERRARLAIDVFCYRLRKYIGAYAAALGGLDILVFTGGIGTNSATIRAQALCDLSFLGIRLDPIANEAATGEREARIDDRSGHVEVFAVPTDEERVIARETARVLARRASAAGSGPPSP